jgi:hypothetical protein
VIVEGRFWAFRNDSDSDAGGAYVEETPKNEDVAVRGYAPSGKIRRGRT